MPDYGNESFDSEGNYMIKKGKEVMSNGDGGKISLDTILKISQALIIPLLLAMFYLLMQINSIDRRFVAVESQLNAFPKLDVRIGKLAVIEDRQNANIRRVETLESWRSEHSASSTYDPMGRNRRESFPTGR